MGRGCLCRLTFRCALSNCALSGISNPIHLEFVFVGSESSVRKYEYLNTVLGFKASKVAALVVQEKKGRNRGESSSYLRNVADDDRRLNLAERFERDELWALDGASAVTVFTLDVTLTGERRTQALARHFEQSKLREAADLDARFVESQRVL